MGMVRHKIFFLTPIMIIFSFFFLYPLVILVLTSLRSEGDGAMTLHNYTQILTDPYYSKALVNSLLLSLAATVSSLVLAGLLAFFLARNEFKGKTLYFTLLTFPMSLPGVVVGFMVIILFGTTGVMPMFSKWLTGTPSMAFAYTITGILLAYLYFEIPRVILSLYGAIQHFDRTLEEAARTLGASPWQAIRYVVLPTVFPIFIASGALAFSTSMSAFGTAFTLANDFDILPILMYNEFTLSFKIEVASAIAVVIGMICVLMNLTNRIIMERGMR
ncbi:Binding-protein-dependent transport systems inner membrane component [Paenibacillus terrae HPL-003]|uniref:Binding-protein-dependent transport systems inner membrane component n=2 Tax=Paenibacillus terrae TaxID=159743 RepID=G7W1L1_PAETH|nr:Binding-protein-dependent transport systems inner membrane component [Paenibacillus terrae HPL-003]